MRQLPTVLFLLLALALASCSQAYATEVRIRPLVSDGTATGTAASVVAIRLVDAAGKPMIGLRTTDGAPVTAYAEHQIPADGVPWVVDLTPQSQIARADAAASYYAVEIRAAHRREPYRIQVPDSAEILELYALVGGAPVDPADIGAGIVPPVWGGTGAATQVRILPLVSDGSATGTAASTVHISLVTSAGQPLLGLRTTDGAPVTAYLTHDIPAGGEAWTVGLTPQSEIATPDGAPTYYAIEIRAAHATAAYRVQVPPTVEVLTLAHLVSASAIDPADILAGRLIPPGGAAGDVLSKASADDYATAWAPAVSDETDPVFSASPAAGISVQDIADWGTALQPGDDAATLGSDTATAGYAPLADGAGGIAWGPVATSTATTAPTAMTVTYGTLDSGTVASLAEKDGTSVAIAEASGANALQVTLDFAGLSSFSSIEIFGRYAGSTSHQIAVEVWDYADSAWEIYGYLPSTATPEWHFFTVADPLDHVSGGAAQVRLRHIQSGVASHDLYLDYVALSAAISGGVIAHADIAGRDVADAHPATAITNTPAGDVAATTVQAAVNELDAEKLAPSALDLGFAFAVTDDFSLVQAAAGRLKANLPTTMAMPLSLLACGVSEITTLGDVEVDILVGGTSILSTTITIEANEQSSLTAAVQPVVSRTATLAVDELISVDVLAAPPTVPGYWEVPFTTWTPEVPGAKGLKCYLAGPYPSP